VKPWIDLYQQHQRARARAGETATAEIRARLRQLVDRGHCDPSLPSRFTYGKNSDAGLREWSIKRAENGEPLQGLPTLRDARLTILLLTGTRTNDLHELTIMLEGRTPADARWCVALHLPDDRSPPHHDRQGSGACSHAALHCHVGPTLDDEPKVRVPLPALTPADALDWVLSQVVPGYEPAPWPAVVAARKD
jgi:hypothetical protein